MIALVLALAALPPLPPFPTELRPRDGTTAPLNAALFALGDPAPAIEQVGVAVTVGGPAAPFALEAVGCCVVRARLIDAPAIGDLVAVTFTSAAGEGAATWTAGPADDTAPTFAVAPSVVDHGQRASSYDVVIGLEAVDDTQIGMVTASVVDAGAGDVVGATVDGFVLTARVPGQRAPGALCLDVIAFDVAENASGVQVLCVDVVEPSEGEGEGEPAPGCTGAGGVPLALVLLALLRLRARPRVFLPRRSLAGYPTGWRWRSQLLPTRS